LAEVVLGSAARFDRLLEIAKGGGEIPAEVNTHATALALQNLMVGLNVLCKVVRSEDELWLLARTTLKGLGLLWEANGAKL
jgi:TetR/AcrR family transcriptional repressor of nem operon